MKWLRARADVPGAQEQRLPPPLPLAAAVAVPGAYLGAADYLGLPAPHLPAPLEALVFGIAIVGAAFVLAWAAEAAQVDINAGLALALLALLAVLPEYAVDFVFTWQCGGGLAQGGGSPPEACNLALANMTGANRVLVGVGWPLVVLVASAGVWWARRQQGDEEAGSSSVPDTGDVRLAPAMSVEVVFLGFATIYSLTLPLRPSLAWWDAAVFVAIFAAYGWRLSRMTPSEPDLLGVSKWVGDKDRRPRRAWVVSMFVLAAVMILLTAEHFAEGLVTTGKELGVSEFLLVQWVAPAASESPELIVACLYAWRLKAADSLGTLLSSKVNQWTLLVGSLPIVLMISAGALEGLPLATEQREELLITAAQSLFAVALLIDLRITQRGAIALLVLFLVQFAVSILAGPSLNSTVIYVLSTVYAALAVVLFARKVSTVWRVVRDGTVTSFEELPGEPDRERTP